MLMRRIEGGYLAVGPQDYERTLSRMFRYNALTYHMRLAYLKPRIKKILGYLHERLAAKRFVQRLSDDCLLSQQ